MNSPNTTHISYRPCLKEAENWAPILSRADFKIDPKKAVTYKVVVIFPSQLREDSVREVYDKIRDLVNKLKSSYRFGEKPHALVKHAGDRDDSHWGAVEKYFSGKVPANIFVLDFVRPRGALDTAYSVVKTMLGKHGYMSQFVNFKTCAHDKSNEKRRSDIILSVSLKWDPIYCRPLG